MANQWLRLWHDMPTDPKWRTIAKTSGQRIGDVMAVYCHLLVCASNATERGQTQSFNCEDVANAIDVEAEQVAAIVDAMQGRVLEGDQVRGWDKRQVAREDGSAERGKAWRATKKSDANAAERKQTPDTEKSREEREEKKEQEKKTTTPTSWLVIQDLVADGLPEVVATAWLDHRRAKKAKLTELAWAGFKAEARKAGWAIEAAVVKAIQRNWITFEADWVLDKSTATSETQYQRSMRLRVEEACPALARQAPGVAAQQNPMEILDGLVSIVG